jgi:hypothetical protein
MTMRTRSRDPAYQIAPLADLVAGIFQDERLRADLHPLGLIGALRDMRPLAFLRIDRRDAAVLALDQIDCGDDAEPLGGQLHRAGDEVRPLVDFIGRWQAAAAAIDAHMRAPPFLGVGGIRPLAIDPFEKGKARAVDPLVDHAHRHWRRVGRRRRGGKFESQLTGGRRPCLERRGLHDATISACGSEGRVSKREIFPR